MIVPVKQYPLQSPFLPESRAPSRTPRDTATARHAITLATRANPSELHGIAPSPARSASQPPRSGPTIVARAFVPYSTPNPPPRCAWVEYWEASVLALTLIIP